MTEFFTSRIDFQIKKMSLAFSDSTRRQIDIVRDVCNVVSVLWVADLLGLPLKTASTPKGMFSAAELRLMLLVRPPPSLSRGIGWWRGSATTHRACSSSARST